MKKKSIVLSLSLAIMILVAITLQSVHSYEHLEKFKTEKKCNHNHNKNLAEINNLHNELDHCFACEFTFSNALKSDVFKITLIKKNIVVHYSFSYSKEINSYFKGSLFALRAPPIV